MSINERIRELRKATGLTQSDFGKRIGVSRDTIANMENERMNISDLHIAAISKEFEVNKIWLETGEGPMKAPPKDDLAEVVASMFKNENDPFYRSFVAIAKVYIDLDETSKKVFHNIMAEYLKALKKDPE